MDEARAIRIARELEGHTVSTWTINEYINHGKSAVVLKATRDNNEVALKIFDPDIVERFGRATQLARIQREKDLIGKSHPNLIEIKDGGECPRTNYLFVAMEYLPQRNLSQVLEEIPQSMIFPIITQVSAAAKFLEDIGLAHRDIKPENISISDDFSHATLFDLGVLRPVGLSNITDNGAQKAFVATLRYSPPELLYREEEDSVEGWKAITFYQIGGVLHDLIMQYPLFRNYGDPYARLVQAVREEEPYISAKDIDPYLVILSKSCLVKDPEIRLKLVSWEKLMSWPLQDTRDSRKKRIKERIIIARGNIVLDDEDARRNTAYQRSRMFECIITTIKDTIRDICVADTECYPPFERLNHEILTDRKGTISVRFLPSVRHALNVSLTLEINVTQSGAPELIIELSSLAIASLKDVAESAKENLEPYAYFSGPYNADIVARKIEDLLLSLLEKGQSITNEDLTGAVLGEIENALQLYLD